MAGASPDWEWGTWMLGDMSDLLRRTLDAVGRAVSIDRVTVAPPETPTALPRVIIVLPPGSSLFALKHTLSDGEYPVRFVGVPSDSFWAAEVLGLRLEVMLGKGSAR